MNPSSANKDSEQEQEDEEEEEKGSPTTDTNSASASPSAAVKAEEGGGDGGEEEAAEVVEAEKMEDLMEEDGLNPATVFCIRLKQPRSNLMHKMSVPELCRNFR